MSWNAFHGWLGDMPFEQDTVSFRNFGPIDATGEKAAIIGRFWHPEHTQKSVSRVQFRWGSSITKAGGSALTLSLQDAENAGSGPPLRPDGSQDQLVEIPNADISANGWYRTNALSADRVLTPGDFVAVVFEFDGAGRLGSDSITFSALNRNTTNCGRFSEAGAVQKLPTWAGANSGAPNVLLECSDGSVGTIVGSFAASALNNVTLTSATNPDEITQEITPPVGIKIDAIGLMAYPSSSNSAFDIVVYDAGGSTIASVSVDRDLWYLVSAAPVCGIYPLASELTLAANTAYNIAVKPTTGNNVIVPTFDVNSASHFAVHPLGTSSRYLTRVDGGSWSENTVRRFYGLALRISAIESGGGVLRKTRQAI